MFARRLFALTALALTSFAAIAPATAQTSVACPFPEAKSTIVDTLPDGWWTTPIVDRLTETRIENIGGQPALVCRYGSAGQIQMRAPAGEPCRAIEGDSSAAAAVTPDGCIRRAAS